MQQIGSVPPKNPSCASILQEKSKVFALQIIKVCNEIKRILLIRFLAMLFFQKSSTQLPLYRIILWEVRLYRDMRKFLWGTLEKQD